MLNLTPAQAARAVALMAMLGLSASEAFQIHKPDGRFAPGRVVEYDRSLFDQGVPIIGMNQFGQPMATNAEVSSPSALAINASAFEANNPNEFLSNYAVRYKDPHQDELQMLREALASEVPSTNSSFVQYPVYSLGDSFLSMDNALDVRRAIGADFTTLRNTSKSMVTQRLPEIGLAVEVDEEEELLDSDWQQRKVAWLLGILDRTELRQAIALLVAGATNVNKTWDATAGKDPDQDVLTELDAMYIKPNNVWFGPGAWIKRSLSLRAQNLAGQARSSTMTMDELGALWGAMVKSPQPRFAATASTLTRVFGSYVFLFSGYAQSKDDFSNLKTFVAPARNGMRRAVWIRQVGDKRWRIVVSTGKRLLALTSAIGLETITVS